MWMPSFLRKVLVLLEDGQVVGVGFNRFCLWKREKRKIIVIHKEVKICAP